LSQKNLYAGVRRIEAVTAEAAENMVNGQLTLLKENPGNVKKSKRPKEIHRIFVTERNELKKKLNHLHLGQKLL
jgi:alanyl-tRNA synthetase